MNDRVLTRRFAEAFMLMKYAGKAGEVEWLWNSRDGVSPFGVSTGSGGGIMNHADWREDVFVPNFVPPIGMRIFVDLTMDKALVSARKRVSESWDRGQYQMKDHPILGPLGPAGAADELAKEIVGNGDQPTVEIVTEEIHDHFRMLASKHPFRQERSA
ncbi:hypothetical protein [Allomesorhizobium camelthorni]|uniref:Uncharacterized protein n=1 Tax=Allomesorhizobium camelthorni TaxID=475069 RepID=A0A6G4W6V9_9HYPH|nr:hypothetical protein [Mesorhizobium camelthorni]NGO50482.1 hypothetical protein [Mesorhizobium camelthorni]